MQLGFEFDEDRGESGNAVNNDANKAPGNEPAKAGTLAEQIAALPTAWRAYLDPFMESADYARLNQFLAAEQAAGKTIYPDDVLRALRLTTPAAVEVVILGQDPYHGEVNGVSQAHGLAFSVRAGIPPPPSLKNIFKEIAAEFGTPIPRHGCLDYWASQGVLLLNTVLTVERSLAASHARHGWEACTDLLIRELAARDTPTVFMLWGAHAQAKRALIDATRHLVLEAPHPSPLSAHRGFLGCGHFKRANAFLEAAGRRAIDWSLPASASTLAR